MYINVPGIRKGLMLALYRAKVKRPEINIRFDLVKSKMFLQCRRSFPNSIASPFIHNIHEYTTGVLDFE